MSDVLKREGREEVKHTEVAPGPGAKARKLKITRVKLPKTARKERFSVTAY